MPRRALTAWMHHRLELNHLLAVRHPLLARPEPGQRVLGALGLASETDHQEFRPRRFVRPLAAPRLPFDEVERPQSDIAAFTKLPAAETEHTGDTASVERFDSDVTLEATPEAMPPVHDDSDEIANAPRIEPAATTRPAPRPRNVAQPPVSAPPQEGRSERVTARVPDRRTPVAPDTPPPPPPPSSTPAAATPSSEPIDLQSDAETDQASAVTLPTADRALEHALDAAQKISPDRSPTPPATANAAPLVEPTPPVPAPSGPPLAEQRRARRPARPATPDRDTTQRGEPTRAADVANTRDEHPHKEQRTPASSKTEAAPATTDASAQPAEPPAPERSVHDWMRLLVEATSKPDSPTSSNTERPVPRPIVPAARPESVRSPSRPAAAPSPRSLVVPAAPASRTASSGTHGKRVSSAPRSADPVRADVTPPELPAAPQGARADAPGVPTSSPAPASPSVPSTAPAVRLAASNTPSQAPHSIDAPLTSIEDEQVVSSEMPALAPPLGAEAEAPGPGTSPTTPRDARAVASALASLPAPAPLAPSARRFLKPLVGIDPDTVRIHRGPAVSQLADRGSAEALTVGDQVVLGPGLDEHSPSTLGVLAHELTHAARIREPRFVPPIVHESTSGDEEPVALEVERAVRHAARHERAAERSIESRGIPESVEPRPRNARRTVRAPMRAPDSVRTSSHRVPSLPADSATDEADMSPWGSLPAPWEPLPEVLTHMLSQPGNGATAVHGAVPESLAPSVPVAESAAAPAVQAAARDRSNDEPASGAAVATATSNGNGSSPAPDVDALARQVYDVLKRRLAAERRRGA